MKYELYERIKTKLIARGFRDLAETPEVVLGIKELIEAYIKEQKHNNATSSVPTTSSRTDNRPATPPPPPGPGRTHG